jgi:hypothetical protein
MKTNQTGHGAPVIVMSVLLSIIVVLLWMVYLGAIRLPSMGSMHVDRSVHFILPG